MVKQPEHLFEAARPIDESKIDPDFVDLILEAAAEPVGEVLTGDEMIRHLRCLAGRR